VPNKSSPHSRDQRHHQTTPHPTPHEQPRIIGRHLIYPSETPQPPTTDCNPTPAHKPKTSGPPRHATNSENSPTRAQSGRALAATVHTHPPTPKSHTTNQTQAQPPQAGPPTTSHPPTALTQNSPTPRSAGDRRRRTPRFRLKFNTRVEDLLQPDCAFRTYSRAVVVV